MASRCPYIILHLHEVEVFLCLYLLLRYVSVVETVPQCFILLQIPGIGHVMSRCGVLADMHNERVEVVLAFEILEDELEVNGFLQGKREHDLA